MERYGAHWLASLTKNRRAPGSVKDPVFRIESDRPEFTLWPPHVCPQAKHPCTHSFKSKVLLSMLIKFFSFCFSCFISYLALEIDSEILVCHTLKYFII